MFPHKEAEVTFNTSLSIGSKEMGLKFAVLLALGTLGMGTTEETFQLEGVTNGEVEKLGNRGCNHISNRF